VGARTPYAPSEARVGVSGEGRPQAVEGAAVETIREEWVVEDRWWTPRPLRRHYFELVLAGGRAVTVFRAASGRWYRQRA
jgi:hypothetical protein